MIVKLKLRNHMELVDVSSPSATSRVLALETELVLAAPNGQRHRQATARKQTRVRNHDLASSLND
jgi:hypothetical protein